MNIKKQVLGIKEIYGGFFNLRKNFNNSLGKWVPESELELIKKWSGTELEHN